MPQIFQVLRCYKCLVFQIHHTKKSNKWQCKMCGEKQSVKRHYGIGNSQECRFHVQKLNELRGKSENEELLTDSDDIDVIENCSKNKLYSTTKTIDNKSKWSIYMASEEISQDVNKSTYLEDEKLLIDKIPTKRKRSDFVINKMLKNNLGQQDFKLAKHEYTNEDNSNEQKMEKIKFPVKNTIINFITPNEQNELLYKKQRSIEQKISKWDKFVDVEGNFNVEDESQVINNNCLNDSYKLFELCDDSELDLVLSI